MISFRVIWLCEQFNNLLIKAATSFVHERVNILADNCHGIHLFIKFRRSHMSFIFSEGCSQRPIWGHYVPLMHWDKFCSRLGLKRLFDIIDNVDNKKLSNFFLKDLIWPNVRACNTAGWPVALSRKTVVQPSWMQFKRRHTQRFRENAFKLERCLDKYVNILHAFLSVTK